MVGESPTLVIHLWGTNFKVKFWSFKPKKTGQYRRALPFFNQHVAKILDAGISEISDEEYSRQKLHRIGENPFVLTKFYGVGAYEAQAIDCQSIDSRCKSDAPRQNFTGGIA